MRPGDTLRATFTLSGAATGTPTAKFLHNLANDSGVTPTVAAGVDPYQWKVSALIPSSGYAVGDTVELSATATVGGVTGSAIIARTVIDVPVVVASLADGSIHASTFNADATADGICQTGNTSTTVHFSATDVIANGLPTGAVNRYLEVVAGTGIGQILQVASIAGSSGSKVGTLAIAAGTTLDSTSGYTWRGSIGLTAIADGSLTAAKFASGALAGLAVASVTAPVTVGTNNDKTGYVLGATGWDAILIETNYSAKDAAKVTLAAALATITGNGTANVTVATLPTPTRGTTGQGTQILATMTGTNYIDRGATTVRLSNV